MHIVKKSGRGVDHVRSGRLEGPKLLVSHTVPTLKALLINSEFKFENPMALTKYYWAVCIYDLDKLGVLDGEG